MPTTTFNRDVLVDFYAKQHLKTDEAIKAVFYLPENSPDREIRFVEVNTLISERGPRKLVPIDFGIDMGQESAHSLFVIDVTPDEWEGIVQGKLALPDGWSLENRKPFP